MTDCRLYLITPPRFRALDFAALLEQALGAGDVAALQLRLKDATDAEVLEAGRALMPIAVAHDVAFLVNDRPDLAAALGADGAHVGGEDMPAGAARSALGTDRQLGVSCYASRDLAMRAGEDGADYVAFGAFFPSRTKDTGIRAELDLLAWWSETMELPVVAIGGITAANCAPLVRAGADFLAVVGAVWDDPAGPAAGVRAMNAAIADASS